MKKIFLAALFIFPVLIHAQNKEAVAWIRTNAIEIENANPNAELIAFHQSIPEKFANAKVFGFGEASHNTKEFFDLKAKFFKYLVQHHGVRTFIMEESYQAEAGINEWIRGGKGDVTTIANNFHIGFWYTKEVVNLLQWMRDYNLSKPKEEQIRFYGVDIQIGKNINLEIRDYIQKHKIAIDEQLLVAADNCANKKIDYSKADDDWETQLPKLKTLQQQLLKASKENKEQKAVLRSLQYLIHYVEYASVVTEKYPTSTMSRDLKMFENAKYIIENKSRNGKAFIWAHNEHINKKEMYFLGSGITNLGRHLKDHYKDHYYSVGFDFGSGKIHGFATDKKKGNHWKTYTIEKPFKKTYAHTLMAADKDIYFLDLEQAPKFFSKKSKQLLIAAGGYKPKPLHKIMMDKIYTETYDGLIFVKKISVPDYKLSAQ